jgi:hypothetical protein
MWRTTEEPLASQSGVKIICLQDDKTLSFAEVLAGWQTDGEFRQFFLATLRDIHLPAFYWEMPAITANTGQRPYEFVAVDSPPLAIASPDPQPFANQLRDSAVEASVVTFPNLGGDAVLVVPKRMSDTAVYTHLATFIHTAPDEQQHELLRLLADTVLSELSTRPLWLNTSGLGVHWLHVRLDDTPKYYTYQPYRARV